MTTMKVNLYNLSTLLLIFASSVMAEKNETGPATVNEDVQGNCTCGGFSSEKITLDSIPLLSQSPGLVVKCDAGGEETCKSLCLALATAAKAKGPEILCNRLTNATELKLSCYFKVCDKPWTYAGMTAISPLCCEDSKAKTCPSVAMAPANVTANPDVKAH